MPHDQWLLMGGVIGLYLYDSALLLFHNEVVLEVRRSGYIVSGGSALEFGGRHLFLPNPCFPHRMLVRLSWPDDSSPAWRVARWKRAKLALSVIAPWTWLLLGLFFVGLPCSLLIGTNIVLLGWLVLTYVAIATVLVQVCRHRRALNLSPRAVVALAFDALLCAPFAINIVRKISLHQGASSSLHAFASSMLSPAENAALAGILRGRIRISLDFLEPGSERSDALHAYLRHFEDGSL